MKIMKNMKKVILSVICMLLMGAVTFANGTKEEALAFFNSYVNASNTYSASLLSMYSSNAKIIRQVVKPNGQLVNVPFSVQDYKKQLKISSSVAKVRKYKNYYSNINVTPVSNGFKVSAKRKPSMSNYKLDTVMVVQKQANGRWLIVEELMQTKEQIFLKYAK